MKIFIWVGLFMGSICQLYAQERSVAVTIDDVPQVNVYHQLGKTFSLLTRLDSLNIPVAIFINEDKLNQTADFEGNKALLAQWISRPGITVGNHSYAHLNYADVGYEIFTEDIVKGERVTRELAEKFHKPLKYFRFPFNSMGNDSLQHKKMAGFLESKGYLNTPYTVESEDWMYDMLYNDALARRDLAYAESVGKQYVEMTIKLFDHFDSLAVARYGRPVKQIYLCHDNLLNARYLDKIVNGLKTKGYTFISLDEALTDGIYKSKEYYYGRAGFSWIYRYVQDPVRRKTMVRTEPVNLPAQQAYEELIKRNK
ncbi:hypothetical protein DYBT9275_00633 [Dyadobacter sp. CECT 9275]|uniref:NodB homology domain-containing protein n=1 Tax=Dyadobacter helix TaxID=2822344 RepID=A0A916J7U1_9BACT|nr:polysaccharide deacetylase family protein [Dyadobacter sp. CECT 9275]CAG4990887.1 hypothetical protein DYBT9275_00633 [Dyadobacter sp. CECT 9275]